MAHLALATASRIILSFAPEEKPSFLDTLGSLFSSCFCCGIWLVMAVGWFGASYGIAKLIARSKPEWPFWLVVLCLFFFPIGILLIILLLFSLFAGGVAGSSSEERSHATSYTGPPSGPSWSPPPSLDSARVLPLATCLSSTCQKSLLCRGRSLSGFSPMYTHLHIGPSARGAASLIAQCVCRSVRGVLGGPLPSSAPNAETDKKS